jgi:hypothetical protein
VSASFFDAVDAAYKASEAGLQAGLEGSQQSVPQGAPACMAAWSRARVRGLCRRSAAKPH